MPRKNKVVRMEIVPRDCEAQLETVVKAEFERQLAEVTTSDGFIFEPFFQTREIANELKRRQSVQEQHKFANAYEDYGCLVCGTKDRPHGALWMCTECYPRAAQRLLASKRRHAADPEVPIFKDTGRIAREALVPALQALAGKRKAT
jgi:hypothetical protein